MEDIESIDFCSQIYFPYSELKKDGDSHLEDLAQELVEKEENMTPNLIPKSDLEKRSKRSLTKAKDLDSPDLDSGVRTNVPQLNFNKKKKMKNVANDPFVSARQFSLNSPETDPDEPEPNGDSEISDGSGEDEREESYLSQEENVVRKENSKSKSGSMEAQKDLESDSRSVQNKGSSQAKIKPVFGCPAKNKTEKSSKSSKPRKTEAFKMASKKSKKHESEVESEDAKLLPDTILNTDEDSLFVNSNVCPVKKDSGEGEQIVPSFSRKKPKANSLGKPLHVVKTKQSDTASQGTKGPAKKVSKKQGLSEISSSVLNSEAQHRRKEGGENNAPGGEKKSRKKTSKNGAEENNTNKCVGDIEEEKKGTPLKKKRKKTDDGVAVAETPKDKNKGPVISEVRSLIEDLDSELINVECLYPSLNGEIPVDPGSPTASERSEQEKKKKNNKKKRKSKDKEDEEEENEGENEVCKKSVMKKKKEKNKEGNDEGEKEGENKIREKSAKKKKQVKEEGKKEEEENGIYKKQMKKKKKGKNEEDSQDDEGENEEGNEIGENLMKKKKKIKEEEEEKEEEKEICEKTVKKKKKIKEEEEEEEDEEEEEKEIHEKTIKKKKKIKKEEEDDDEEEEEEKEICEKTIKKKKKMKEEREENEICKKVKKKKRKNKEDCQEEEEEEENEKKNEICEKPAKKKKKKIEIKKKSKKVKVEMMPTEMVPSLEKYDPSEESDLDQEEEEEERDDEEVQEEEEERDDEEVQEEEEEERDDEEVQEEEEEEDSASDGENEVSKPKAPQEETKTKSSEKPRLPFCVKKKDEKPKKDSKQTLQKTSKEKSKKKPKSCEPKSTRCKRYSMREREIVDTGTWVQCTNSECLKWRFLHDVQDPITVPALWTCDMNPDVKQNDCSYSEIQPSKTDIDEFIYTKYTEGTVVWARVDGYPWWPAMVEMDPDSLSYFDIETETSMYPKYYHVVFFGKKVSRAWVTLANISQFVENKPPPVTKGTLRLRTREINEAEKLAVKALEVPINTRLKLFSFSNRYKGFWGDCTCNTCTRAAKSKPTKEDSDEDL